VQVEPPFLPPANTAPLQQHTQRNGHDAAAAQDRAPAESFASTHIPVDGPSDASGRVTDVSALQAAYANYLAAAAAHRQTNTPGGGYQYPNDRHHAVDARHSSTMGRSTVNMVGGMFTAGTNAPTSPPSQVCTTCLYHL
jgi:hypothetical protein